MDPHQQKLRFLTANGAGLFTAEVMFIYIFAKNDIGLTHRDITHIYGHRCEYKQIPKQTVSYDSTHRTSNVKVKDTYSHWTTYGRETDNKI